MGTFCVTRAMKVLGYLHRTVPKSIPRSSLLALAKLPPSVLSTLHTGRDLHKVTKNAKLRNWLSHNPIPAPKARVSEPLFKGTLVFVGMTFNRPNQPPSSVSAADVQTARNYAALAAVPIQRYASQYGPNTVRVSPDIIPFSVMTGNTFPDEDVWGWVDKIVGDNQLTNACIVILADSATSPTNTFKAGDFAGYHMMTDKGHPYCFCKVLGQNLTVADPTNRYAAILSHEIAEMVVDPRANLQNPEVCDACSIACHNDQWNLFDSSGNFIGGTNDLPSASGFSFFISSIIQPEFYDPATECAVQGADKQAVCIYAPPLAWNGQGDLTTVNNIVSVSGHFSTGDQRHLVVVGTANGRVHEIFWKPAQQGIEGEDDLPVAFGVATIVSVAALYNSDQQRHLVLVAKKDGKVQEIFWKPETVGIEGHDDLPVTFSPGTIVAVSGLYDSDQQRHLVVVGTTAGRVHEIFWKADTVGVEGHDDLPVTFPIGSIVAVTAFYNTDQKRYVVVVGTSAGKLHEIFWKSDTVGIEGHEDLPVSFDSGSIVAVSGFYDGNKQRHVVVIATSDGQVHQVYWKATTVGIEAHSIVTQFSANSIVSVAGFYSGSDQLEHIVVGLKNGRLRELWMKPDI
jgi:hypothetical protein